MRSYVAVMLCTLGCSAPTPVELDASSFGRDRTLVHTSDGLAQGVVEGSTRVWRGLPFAQPPVGNLRWKLPRAPLPWKGVRDASQFQAVCAQRDFAGNDTGSEDCLYLNVYAPANAPTGAPLPVLVWVHGGGNVRGSGQTEAHALADAGAVVVTVEYRMSTFGWLALQGAEDEEGTTGAYGLYDVLAALEWVQKNAHAFGGDRREVLVFGQSAGSYDVGLLLTAAVGPGTLFTRAAMQSNGFMPGDLPDVAQAKTAGAAAATLLGCTGTAAQQLACMRGKPAMELVDDYYAQANTVGAATGPAIDHLLVDGDPATVLHDRGAPVPLVIGSTRDELSIFHDRSETLDAAGFPAAVAKDFPSLADQIVPLYPLSDYSDPLHALIDVESDGWLTCIVRNDARMAASAVRGQPVYRYLYTHTLESGNYFQWNGAAHTMELPFLFGFGHRVYMVGPNYQPTAAELELSAALQGYWIRFARTGDPNGAGAPAWPRYDASERMQYLDDTIATGPNYHAAQCDLMSAYPF